MKERFYATVECAERYGTANKQFELYCEFGKMPSIGDYVEAFRRKGHELEITDFITMTFKPVNPSQSPVIAYRVIRALKDHSFTADQLRMKPL
ncbi:hypothetical protein [Paenibacillus methanolicus]|uniref:Uncharacterized protein n=1 Tax=Paenibacillus methanolicus TaxID=582686 RepID=A0A5S5CKQ7_9BACL|nr:hypothetical protein [Paenibacillus methanolicus]TYP79467.1 hypothetical protein BCM02_101585 [Paenibacillus methanolicus]